jgi:hypothetical protein
MHRPLLAPALLALLVVVPNSANAQNTRPTRAFTSEFVCDNGRTLLVNAHPRRPREVTHITYLGNRVEMKLEGPVADGRYVGRNGQVEWLWSPSNRQEGRLRFDDMTGTPVTCVRKEPEPKNPTNK